MRPLRLSLFGVGLILQSILLLGTTADLEVTATLPPGIAEEDVKLEVFLDGSSKPVNCTLSGIGGDGPIYACEVPEGTHSGRFRFKMPGFNPYSLNVASFRSREELRLGELRPTPASVPRIENIVRTMSSEGVRFEITVNNLAKVPVLIKGIRLFGSGVNECGIGTEPPIYFKVSKTLVLTPQQGNKQGIRGTIAAPGDHPEFPYELTGTGVFYACGTREFDLHATMNFTLPASGYYEIEIVVPASGRAPLRNARSSPARRVEVPTTTIVDMVSRIRFTLETSDPTYSEIRYYWEPSLTK